MREFAYIVLIIFPLGLCAQKHDYIWLTGDDNLLGDSTRGGNTINFHFYPPNVSYNYRELNFRTCNASICDTAGNLLFYTNGCSIAGADDEILENGNELNPGYVYQLQCTPDNYYNSGFQSSIILPVPDSDGLFYLFHKRLHVTFDPTYVRSDRLFYSKVDMNSNNGKGRVIEKNVEIMNGDLSIGEMVAVKHANGTDWWLVSSRDHSNTFYVFLFTKDGIVDTLVQSIGTAPRVNASGGMQVAFTPDGSKFFRTNPQQAVKMYDFDRASGVLTAFDTIAVDYKNYPDPVTSRCGVSPNSRYLYVTTALYVFQFDLWASDISASQLVVAEWDGFKDPIGTTFGSCQLGPDCKIYICTIDSRYYHVINAPDEPGVACNVTQHSFLFPTSTGASIPFFPNYRLGPLDNPGLPCSPVVSTAAPTALLPAFSVFPNPVSTTLNIVPNRQFNGPGRFCLFDVTGRMVRDVEFDPALSMTEMDVSEIPVGLYVYEIWYRGGKARSGKVVKVGN